MTLTFETALTRLLNLFKTGSAGTPTPVVKDVAITELLDYAVATAAHPGIVELATQAETLAGADASRSVTPASLALSIDAAKLAADAVTGPKINATAFLSGVFTGSNGVGACTLTGAKVGDKVVLLTNLSDAADGQADFESTITVVDQIQQISASDYSLKKFGVLLIVKS